MVTPRAKQWLMAGLVFCLVVQTFLVYSDEPGSVVLQGDALAGAELWHDHNCQACHQLYGFGGFLGPDLTNASARLGNAGLIGRLKKLLRDGSGQMPAFGLDEREAEQIAAFLFAMNETGTGQLRQAQSNALGWAEVVSASLSESSDDDAKRGWAAFSTRPCHACHRLMETGLNDAPALVEMVNRLDEQQLLEVLTNGRPPNMPTPTPSFSDEEKQQVVAMLRWLATNKDPLESVMNTRGSFVFSEVPWYEYAVSGEEQ